MRSRIRTVALALGLACTAWAPCALAQSIDEKRQEAVELYAAGNFPEAGLLLLEIDRAGAADGPSLYRLAYCQRTAGDLQDSLETQRRAKVALESEVDSATSLEVPFYLVNTYQNIGLNADVARVARETTARVENGDVPMPASRLDMFRLGKLYADQDASEKAIEWYEKSLDDVVGENAGASYVRWASRYVAERSFDAREYDRASRYFSILTEAGEATIADLDRLGIASVRAGKYTEAAEAWSLAEKTSPSTSDRSHYCRRLADMASKLRKVPQEDRQGGAWTALTKEDLEAILTAEAENFRELLSDVESIKDPTDAERKELRRRINESKAQFVMAGLEYALRGHPIRETAFFGGYAPLILRPTAWRPAWKARSRTTKAED